MLSLSRRDFLKQATVGGAALLSTTEHAQQETRAMLPEPSPEQTPLPASLAPGCWIWYPSGRTLPNTFVLFRTDFELSAEPLTATGWVSADSRYLLSVNGVRVQRGPAPCDPRFLEADPVDCALRLHKGKNTIGATVLFYGHGDGTSPFGKPGFIFLLNVACEDGSTVTVASGDAWQCLLARSWRPGQYKRWYIRSLQEEFDARSYPYGWDRPEYALSAAWTQAMRLNAPSDKPPLVSSYPDDLNETSTPAEICALRVRMIPHLREEEVRPARLASSHLVTWKFPPEQYFECAIPAA